MFANRRYPWTMLAACAIALLMAGPSRAEDPDTREVASYRLTETGLSRYMQATRNLVPFGKDLSNCDNEDTSMTIDAMVARLDAVPGVDAAIESAGMTAREYVVFAWALIHNGMAAWLSEQQGAEPPADISPANVAFYKQHAAEIGKLGQEADAVDCDDTGDEDYDEDYDEED